MRLRNKETGETGYLELEKGDDEKYTGLRVYKNDFMYKRYDSLAGVLEEWEDYKPKEPLIKDEKIRKAVRAWAEVNKTNRVWVSVASDGISITQDEQYPPSTKYKQSITFECEVEFKSDYCTIAELCGEEEE